ncbi:MAG: ComF family protein [Candidatus Pacebacteria bacterium]|nr:ComF family protein [Candidatus Paceibacterota bacterium]
MQIDKYFSKIHEFILDVFIPLNKGQKYLKNIDLEEFLSLTEKAEIPPIKDTISILNYKNKLVKEAIWSLKFKNNQKIAKLFAQIIYDVLVEELGDLKLSINFDKPILITIPMTRKKQRERGYNQVNLIAQELAKLDNNNSFEYQKNILKKTRETLPQSRIRNKKDRKDNLKGCFKVIMPKRIKNRNIILLDDVLTSGATIQEVVSTLKKSRLPKKIMAITLAH